MKSTYPAYRIFMAVLFACSLMVAGLAQAQEKTAPQEVATIEGITEYRLPNGTRFLLFPDDTASTVTVNMTVLVGSRHEGYGETGMAHLLEHMLFKGSKLFPQADKALISHGAGRSSNGTTWVDRTNYYETMPASDENLEFGIKFEADRLVNCFVKREDLVSEMTVVRNEFENGENNPSSVLNQRMMAIAFEWHNYGKSTIGNRSDIERVPIERLQAFYRKYYQPDNVVMMITGKFDKQKALDYMTKYFGAIPRPDRKLDNTYTEEPAQDGERTVLLRRVGKVPLVGVMYHIPAAAHPDNAVSDVLNMVLGEAPAGRLYKALVDTKKATSVSVGTSNWHDPGVLEVLANVADNVKPEEVRDIIISELEQFKPASKEETNRAIKKYLSEREQSLTNSKTIGLEVSEWIGAGDWRLLFIHRDRIGKVTPEDVTRVAHKYLKQPNRTVGMYFPSDQSLRTTIPDSPSVAQLVKNYKGGKSIAAGEAFDTSPKNIEARVQRQTLPSGMKVALLPKKTRGETVVGEITIHFGNEKSLAGLEVPSSVLGPLMKRGTKKHTRQEIVDLLAKLSSSLNVSSSAGELTVGWQSKRESLPALLDLVYEILREPTFPTNELDELQRKNIQSIQKNMTDPQAIAFNTLGRKLYPFDKDDVRYRPTFQENLERWSKLSRDQVVKLYQEQLGAGGEIVLVGDFDANDTMKRLQHITAEWKASVPYERIATSANTKIAGSKESILTPDKEGATLAAGFTMAMKDMDPEYPALVLGNFLLGGNFSSRLVDRLRQKEGLCYGVGSQLRVGSLDPNSAFFIYAIMNPENTDKVEKGALEELAKIVKKGVSDEELAAGKKAYLQDLVVRRGNDDSLTSMLQEGLFLGRTFEYYADLEKKIAALSAADVNRALSTRVDPKRLVIVKAGDFEKNKK